MIQVLKDTFHKFNIDPNEAKRARVFQQIKWNNYKSNVGLVSTDVSVEIEIELKDKRTIAASTLVEISLEPDYLVPIFLH